MNRLNTVLTLKFLYHCNINYLKKITHLQAVGMNLA